MSQMVFNIIFRQLITHSGSMGMVESTNGCFGSLYHRTHTFHTHSTHIRRFFFVSLPPFNIIFASHHHCIHISICCVYVCYFRFYLLCPICPHPLSLSMFNIIRQVRLPVERHGNMYYISLLSAIT